MNEKLVTLFWYKDRRATIRIRVNQQTYFIRSNTWLECATLFRALWMLADCPTCERRTIPLLVEGNKTKGILEFRCSV